MSDEDVVGDVEWQKDADGTEWFLEDGVRYELAEDGYAYPVDDDLTPDVDESAASPVRAPEDETHAAPTKQSDEVSRLGKPSRKDRKAEKKAAKESEKAAATDQEAPEADQPGPDEADAAAKVDKKAARADKKAAKEAAKADHPTAEDPSPFSAPGAAVAATPTISVREPVQWPSGTDVPTGDVLLELSGLKSGYGKLPVLHGVDFEILRGETAVMLGLNGAGKTTTAMNICGALGSWDGRISFEGQDITQWGTRECVSNGIVMVPEGRRVFPQLSVLRNLQVGAWTQRGESGWLDHQREVVFDYFPRLRERTAQLAGTLSGGEQQMLAVGRGLMANPKMLIIDEASMGLAPVIVKDVFDIVAQISSDGVTVLLIEQNVGALEVADVGFVMEQGKLVRTLRGAELADRSQVTEILMG